MTDSTMTPAIRVRCLGVGEGWPSADRNPAAFLYEGTRGRLLIDCGPGTSRSLKTEGIDSSSLDAVALSHFHSDHVGGFSMLIQSIWLEGRRRSLPVHAPGRGLPALLKWLQATLLFPELIGFPVDGRPLMSGEAFRAGALRITPFPTRHLEGLRKSFGAKNRGASFECFGFEVAASGRRVLHSADIGDVGDLTGPMKRPVDLLVCEMSHVAPEELWGALAGTRLGRLALVHLDRDLWRHRRALVRDARRKLPGVTVQVPSDGDVLVV